MGFWNGGTMNGQKRRRREKHTAYDRSVYQSLALVSQFGIHMLVPVFLLSFAGMWLDRRLHTSFWVVVLFFVGALAGFRNIFRLAQNTMNGRKEDDRRADAEEAGKKHEKDQ